MKKSPIIVFVILVSLISILIYTSAPFRQWLNENQGIIAIIAIVVTAFISIWIYKKQSTAPRDKSVHHNQSSPFIKAGGDISAGRDIAVGNHKTRIQNPLQSIPETHLQLNGNATRSLEGHIEKKSDKNIL